MQVILLERVEKLGQMGDEVKVKDGFARNYLLPKKKALRATDANREYFKTQKSQLEARNLERKKEADAVSTKLAGKSFVMLRQAGDRGQLYGSVSPRDIADLVTAGGFSISRGQVPLDSRQRCSHRGRGGTPGAGRRRAGRGSLRRSARGRAKRRSDVRGRRRPQARGRNRGALSSTPFADFRKHPRIEFENLRAALVLHFGHHLVR
jgi:ribosomal protein L9